MKNNKWYTKMLSILLVAMLLVSVLPMAAFADGDQAEAAAAEEPQALAFSIRVYKPACACGGSDACDAKVTVTKSGKDTVLTGSSSPAYFDTTVTKAAPVTVTVSSSGACGYVFDHWTRTDAKNDGSNTGANPLTSTSTSLSMEFNTSGSDGFTEGIATGKAFTYVPTLDKTAGDMFTVTYTDGVEGEEVFADQVYTVLADAATPKFDGTPEREGYEFTGWDPQVAAKVTADAVYTATWTEVDEGVCTITFDSGYSSMTIAKDRMPKTPVELTVDKGTKIDFGSEEMQEFFEQFYCTYNGYASQGLEYVVTGWYNKDTGKIATDGVFTATGNITLTAQWGQSPIPVYHFYTDFEDAYINAYSQKGLYNYFYNEKDAYASAGTHRYNFASMGDIIAAYTENPALTFVGWFDGDGNLLSDKVTLSKTDAFKVFPKIDADTDIEVRFVEKAEVVITLDTDGGNEIDPISAFPGVEVELPEPEKAGYSFLYWADKEGNEVANPFCTDEDVTLTAVWEANEYTLSFDNGEEKVVTFDAAVGELPVPEKEGYTFCGWFDAEGTEYTAETVYTVVGDTELTSCWTANTYKLTLDGETEIEVTFDAAVGELPVPEKEGYTFCGWFDADGNEYTAETIYKVAGDTALTSKFVKHIMLRKEADGTISYLVDGVIDYDYYGFIEYNGGMFLIAHGRVVTEKNGLADDPNDPDAWYFLSHGQVQLQKSGLVQYNGEWFFVENGKLDVSFSGVTEYDGGLFLIARGRVVSDKNGLGQDPITHTWYYFAHGQVQTQYTGLAKYDGAWFYVQKGVFLSDFNGEVEYNGHLFLVKNGKMEKQIN